jgi:hypothetical protein
MCSTSFTVVLLAQTAEALFPAGTRKQSETVTLHFDNCSIHRSRVTKDFMEHNDMESMLHPPYSPDLAPSDFFLFSPINNRLDQFECDDPNTLFEAVSEILGTIQTDDLRRVFQRWIERVAVVAMGDGGSIPDSTIQFSVTLEDLHWVGLAQGLIPRMIFEGISIPSFVTRITGR